MRTLDEIEQELLARWPESSIDPTLERITMLLRLLGEPHRDFRCVHLTGTNGKTSTARMVESLLAAYGLRTGRFTSPHLTTIRERICLGEDPIDPQRFVRTYWGVAERAGRVDAACDHAVSFFEMTVAMAYLAFARHRVQAAVVEVGMGGRWDATNVVDADVAAILPVALDHTDYLGPTIEAIAAEKAGIIKPGAVAVSARQRGTVATILEDRAREVGATLVVEGRDFAVTRRSATESGQLVSFRGLHGEYDDVLLPLHGEHQAQNAAVAIASAEAFLGRPVDLDLVRRALGRVTSPGRFEIRAGTPPVILDAAHNPHGARALARNLAEHASVRTVAVLAVMGDKDYAAVLRELEGVVDQVVCTRSSSPRSLPADELAACARDVLGAGRVRVAANVASALATARALAAGPVPVPVSRVLVTGSVVTVADATRVLAAVPEQRQGMARALPAH
jgi:dihydrofolate synthase/folylpolyglutamate synthase